MLYHLIYPLSKYLTILNVFGYITVRAGVAFVLSFGLTLIIFPIFIKKMKQWKVSQIIRIDGPQSHNVKTGTPTMGGIVVIAVVLLTMLITGNLTNLYILILIFCTISFGFIGMIDDYLKITMKSSDGLHAKFKLISQVLLGLIITICIYLLMGKSAGEITIPFIKSFKLDISILYIPFGVFLITGFSNAVNLTDGLDGLAGGLLMVVFATFGLLSYMFGHKVISDYLLVDYLPKSSEILVYCFAMLGGLCGFLWFNSHPAEIFMGDTGSLSFGGIIGTISMMIRQELLLGIVGGIFVAETVSVIIQVLWYKKTRKRFFLMAPLHHHFELKGWKESKIINRFWILGAILSVVALSSLKLR